MVAIKYTYEKSKREEFINNREQVRWHEIMENVVSAWTMLIGYDKKQD